VSAVEVHSCGTPLHKWPPFGVIISVRDDDAAKLLQFYRGELDEVRCEGCGRPLSPSPSLVVSFNEYTLEYLYYGPAAKGHPDVRQIEEDAKAKGTTLLSSFENPDELRAAAWQVLQARAAGFYRALDIVLTDGGEHNWEVAWPEVTSSACAAMMASRLARLPVPVDSGIYNSVASYSRERVSRGFQEVQARTWVSVCERRSLQNPPDFTLEQDFQKYLATSAAIGGAPELFFDHIALLDLPQLNAGTRYAYYAAEATLHWLLQTPNPHADAWASSYLALEVYRATCPPEQAAPLAALSASDQRVRDTIERQSLARAVSQTMANGIMEQNTQNAVQAAVTKAGHPDLVGAGYTHGKFVRKDGSELPMEELAEMMRDGLRQYSNQPKELEVWLDLMRQSLPKVSGDQLIALTKDLENPYLNNPITLAIVRSWLGRILCMRRQPQPFLAHIGADPEPWESLVPLDLRCILWLWRGRALLVSARPDRSLALLTALIDTDRKAFTDLKQHIQQMVLGDVALAHIDLGHQDSALAILTSLLNDPKVERTPWLLRAAAASYERLGRDSDAIPLWREALTVAVQSEEELRPVLHVCLASALARRGEEEEARQLLDQISNEALSNPEVFIPYSVALLNLGLDGLSEAKRNRFLSIAKRAGETAIESLKNEDTHLHMTACRLCALISGASGSIGIWELLESSSREFEGSPDPLALLVLARRDWERDEVDAARRRLLEFPESLAARYADTRDVSVFLHALEQLRSELNLLGDQVAIAAAPSANTRLVGELQRDLLGRIAARSMTENSSGFVAPDDDAVLALASDEHPVGVLEWISGTTGVRWLLTTLGAGGEFRVSWLQPPILDLQKLGAKLHQRLQTWYLGRPGDPLDLPAWQSFESWLANALEGHLPEGGTLVVIEHTELAGIPWHVAAAPRWRTSYISSWTALLRARDTPLRPDDLTLGLTMVPKYHEGATNVAALDESVARTQELAASMERTLHVALREDCDHDGLLRVLESSSVAKILCHGFVSPSENVVALCIAHGGILPPADSMTAGTAAGQQHRFDWRECRRLRRAPLVVVSAACSSGRSHLAGIGERLGLFSILRGAGTRSLIAPRWDLKYLDVTLPILDRVVELYLREGQELGEALHRACMEAERLHPRWLAWTLSLEGDWK
jgi:tetratricopeptide (TPR) repeat protein